MKNKYTVVTKSQETQIIEVLHVEAKDLDQAFKKAVKQIIDQMMTDGGELSKEEKEQVYEDEELICILEGHCKCLTNGWFND
jgi:hypothetical protein